MHILLLKSCKVHKAQCFYHNSVIHKRTLTSQTLMPKSHLARTQPPRTDEYINALFATQSYNPTLNCASAYQSRHRARILVARNATPRSTLATAVSHDLHLHGQRHLTRNCTPLSRTTTNNHTCSCFLKKSYLIYLWN